MRYAVLLCPAFHHGSVIGVRFQIATPSGGEGAEINDHFFKALEKAVNESRSNRGKILSLERDRSCLGQVTGIKVHKLRKVE